MMKKLGVATFLVAILMLSFTAQPILAQTQTTESFNSNVPGTTFLGDATQITNGTASFNFIGTGGNDTFNLYGGNASAVFIVASLLNNTFNIVTGNPDTGTNSSTFSLISGDNSTFNIVQDNFNGSAVFSITGGANCFVNDTSTGPVSNTIFLINLGSNSTVILHANFTGETMVNEVDPVTHLIISQTKSTDPTTSLVQVSTTYQNDTAAIFANVRWTGRPISL